MNNSISNRVLHHAIDFVAAALKIPRFALKLFRLADEMSGLERKNIPKELIPLNAIQLARGLLNYTALQSLPGWIFPAWAERQFDPTDPAFIPRSHMGLSVNVTGRNWTAVGSPECPVEPVVDVRGAVTPFSNRWSLDAWVRKGNEVFFPSRASNVRQQLLDGVPIVETSFDFQGLQIDETAYVDTSTLSVDVSVTNVTSERTEFCLAYALRPFNPEGVAPVHKIRWIPADRAFLVDETETVCFGNIPTEVHCSNRGEGDCAVKFSLGNVESSIKNVECQAGLANAYAGYTVSLGAGETASFSAIIPLLKQDAPVREHVASVEDVAAAWNSLLREGAQIVTPDQRINLALRSSLSTLLLLTDGDEITPGPWTYHQFWFRDAAYMLAALDIFGFHKQSKAVIRAFPDKQDRKGYFRSQQGEWDSNGQALWTVWHHTMLAGDGSLAHDLIPSLRKGVKWIAQKRLSSSAHENGPCAGLMPVGLSAEHLGLCDYYFWDNWWSQAGVQSYARLARGQGCTEEAGRAEQLLEDYRASTRKAIEFVQKTKALKEIPAGPLRGIDSGMIGSCAAWYPLQELPPDDAAMLETICTLTEKFSMKGLFFQDFIHSGGNPYLTLQLAEGWLYAGKREEFWRLFTKVLAAASPTLNYPEAIHPQTGGGAMGDGHHGWAAAEVVMALRNAIVQDFWKPGDVAPDLVFFGGIPSDWCTSGKRVVAHRLPVPGGCVSLEVNSSTHGSTLDIDYHEKAGTGGEKWTVKLPVSAQRIMVDGIAVSACKGNEGETTVVLTKKVGKTRVEFVK